MVSPRYSYQPLQSREIRLLQLHPGEKQTKIQLSLVHVYLQDNVDFEALSYTWGDGADRVPIACNEAGDVLEVTRNCELALRALRRPDTMRILWVDNISIDQGNIEERNSQILLMPDIYHGSARVVAFLGDSSVDSDIGMDFISDDAKTIQSGNRPFIGKLHRKAIDSILERAYFERAWIIQEILLAKDILVVLGDRAVEWKAFSSTVSYVNANKKLHFGKAYRSSTPAVVHWRDKSAVTRPRTLLHLLDKTRYCKATDPRDKVYALLAISPEKDEKSLAPDYSLSPTEVFLSIARYLLVRYDNLDVLCHCQGTPSPHGLPSWVPDWSI
ncbi:HET-domain-containing protein, partial [Setomelanomma holmii]